MNRKIIYCNCKGNIIDEQRLDAIGAFVAQLNVSSVKLSDLCGVCAKQENDIPRLFATDEEYIIVACYPRAVKLLLNKAGVNLDGRPITFINFRTENNDIIFNKLQNFAINGVPSSSNHKEMTSESEWPAWYPAIDDERCTTCGQCADFCLFGVYEKADGKVTVVNPEGCKNSCPACARICPHTAIVFPKYKQGGAIAGDDTIDELAEQQRQRQDIDDILGSDIYQALEQRKAKRRSLIKAEAMNKAMEERETALNEKKQH